MKKSIISLGFIACLAGTITSCGPENTEIEHHYSDTFEKDSEYHWRKCTDAGCSDIITEKVAHVWDENSHTHVDPTCLAKGFDIDVCKDCGYLKKVELEKLEHNYVAVQGEDCYKKCSLCGSETEHKAHDYNDPVIVEATYERAGSSTKTCQDCGKTVTETIEKLVHHYSDAYEKDATQHWHKCTDEGFSDLTTEKAAHIWDATRHQHVDPTCLTKGYDLDVCGVCGYEKRVELDKLEHNYVAVQGEDCYKKCSLCGTETEHKAHNYGEPVVVEATYEADGYSQKTCQDCGKTVTETYEKLEHHYEGIASDDDYHWTPCTDAGYEDLFINKVAHNYKVDYSGTTLPTCISEGLTKLVCTVCEHVKYDTNDKLAHEYDGYHSNGEGHYLKCVNCGHEEELIPHTFVVDNSKCVEPTCTEDGKTVEVCTACGFKVETPIEHLGHNYQPDDEKSVAPTCKADGKTVKTCTICGDSVSETLEKIDHIYATRSDATNHWEECIMCGLKKNVVKHNFAMHQEIQPTCVSEGRSIDTCVDCGYVKDVVTSEPSGHTLSSYEYNEDSHWQICSVCNQYENKAHHSFDPAKHIHVDATCTTAGYDKDVCCCGYTVTVEIPSLGGHSYETKHDETNHWQECTKCGDKIEIVKHGFDFNESHASTCTVKGYTEHLCTACGYSYQEEKELAEHYAVRRNDNNQHWTVCFHCGTQLSEKEDHNLVSDGPSQWKCTICNALIKK